MIISKNIKDKLQYELRDAQSIWIATAMVSFKGWQFIQNSILGKPNQHFLIGIDLATEPVVFKELLSNPFINARIYQTKYTFHPKVYIIQRKDNSFTSFIGSSNTTSWGLEKNVEMNFQNNDQTECLRLLNWFNDHYKRGYIISEDFLNNYTSKYEKVRTKVRELNIEVDQLNYEIAKDEGQYFSRNNHEVFKKEYHRLENNELKAIRKEVSDKFKRLHEILYPDFKKYGLNNLHPHHNKSYVVSRHYFNQFSGNIINAIWLHYGKSKSNLSEYANGDTSINRPDSFINNIRIQVIIHQFSLGIWLVLGRNNGSHADRNYFRKQMQNNVIRETFFNEFKKLGKEYWTSIKDIPPIQNIETPEELHRYMQKETIDDYFIIGRNINFLDRRLSSENISHTILLEFQKLYPLYEIMRHK